MNPLDDLVEARIREARDGGVFDDLPGRGKPLVLPDDSRVPPELRGAYSVLQQAGMLPEEMEVRQSMVTLRSMLAAVADGDERVELEARLRDMSLRYDLMMERRRGGGGAGLGRYRGAVARRLFGG